jgi:hypothetical protein
MQAVSEGLLYKKSRVHETSLDASRIDLLNGKYIPVLIYASVDQRRLCLSD